MEHMKNFLDTDRFIYGSDLRMPIKLFIQNFRHYCQQIGTKRIENADTLFELPFLAKNLVIINYRGDYRGKMYTDQDFVFGLDTTEVSYADLDV